MNKDEVKIRELEKDAMEKLIGKGWVPLGGDQFRGYLHKVVDGEENFCAPDGRGGYYFRR